MRVGSGIGPWTIASVRLAVSTMSLAVLVRVHSQCVTGDVFHSMRCDCGEQLASALQIIDEEGRGVLVYLPQEGRGIGLLNKLRAYTLQDEGVDTVEANLKLGLPADLRDYGIRAQIRDRPHQSIRIRLNNPKKIVGLEGYGLSVPKQVPIESDPNVHNEAYLRAKRDKMGHSGLPAPRPRRGDDPRRGRARRQGRRWLRPAPSLSSSARTSARPWCCCASASASAASTRTSPSACSKGAGEGFELAGVPAGSITEVSVPGAYELPFAAEVFAEQGYDGVACLGVVIRGETDHYDFVCAEAARGIQDVQLETGIPCAFGVITCDNMEQALARAGGGKRDQGRNAACTSPGMAVGSRALSD